MKQLLSLVFALILVNVAGAGQPKLDQTITFGNLGTKTYGDAPIVLNATASSGLTVTYTVVVGPGTITGNLLTITGAGTIKVAANQAGNNKYNPAPTVIRPFTVLPASLVLSGVTAKDKIYDGNTSARIDTTGAGLGGILPGDSVTLDASAAGGDFSDPAVGKGKPVSTHGFALSGSSSANYTLIQPTSTASILPSAPVLSISRSGGNSAQVTLTGSASGQAWLLQATTDLLGNNWTSLTISTAGTNGVALLNDPDAASYPSRFYRAVSQ